MLCKQERYFLTISNYVFTIVFALEMLVKVSLNTLVLFVLVVVVVVVIIIISIKNIEFNACQSCMTRCDVTQPNKKAKK